MISRPLKPELLRVCARLAGLALRRKLNQWTHAFGKKKSTDKRMGTAGKRRGGPMMAVFLVLILGWQGFFMARVFLGRVAQGCALREGPDSRFQLDKDIYFVIALCRDAESSEDAQPGEGDVEGRQFSVTRDREDVKNTFRQFVGADEAELDRIADRWLAVPKDDSGPVHYEVTHDLFGELPIREHWTTPGIADPLRGVVVVILAGILLAVGLMSADFSEEGGQVTWDMEWLYTLPVSTNALYMARILERMVANTMLYFLALPFLAMCLYSRGYPLWVACGAALVCGVYMNLLLACGNWLLNVWAHKRLTMGARRNLQALVRVAGIAAFFLLILVAVRDESSMIPDSIGLSSLWLAWTPMSAPALLLHPDAAVQGVAFAVMGVYATIALGLTLAGIRSFLADGLVRDTGLVARRAGATRRTGDALRSVGLARREFLQLMRDRALVVQSLIVPLLSGGFYLFVGNNKDLLESLSAAAATGFGIGAYMLLHSNLAALVRARASLWLMFTYPVDLYKQCRRAALPWNLLGMAFCLAFVIFGAFVQKHFEAMDLVNIGLALAGIFCFGDYCAAMAVSATDLQAEVRHSQRPSLIYFCMFIGMLYVAALAQPLLQYKLIALWLLWLMTTAEWQHAATLLPHLLDPVDEQEPSILAKDGLNAALVFIVTQGLAFLVFSVRDELSPGATLMAAFVVAGLFSALLSLWNLRRRGMKPAWKAIFAMEGEGLSGLRAWAPPCLVAVAVGLGWSWMVKAYQWNAVDMQSGEDVLSLKLWFAALAVLAAPVAEEIIFRGLLYRGLKGLISPRAAMLASAFTFSLLHPPVSIVPVFIMGMLACRAFERSGRLGSAILLHLTYNAIILAFQL